MSSELSKRDVKELAERLNNLALLMRPVERAYRLGRHPRGWNAWLNGDLRECTHE